ncbi:VOC family protein [Streptomyces ardesiacus]
MVHVLSSRTLLRPTDPDRTRAFYGEQLGLAVHREFGTGPERGTVCFLGGGFLEVSGRSEEPVGPGPALWLQVEDAAAAHDELRAKGVGIVRPPVKEPWGLVEMWIEDPDGTRIVLVEVPAEHPLRYRPGI